jgi:hypothetical protein
MTEDEAPPTPLPHAAQSPYPAHPAPHAHRDEPPPPAHVPEGPAIGALGITLIGGAVAAALSLLVAIPLLRRKPKPVHKQAPPVRRPRHKRTD